MKTLVVDDEIEISELIKLILEIDVAGSETIIANDGDEAIEILKKINDIDLVICDYSMPKVKGSEVLQFITEHEIQSKFVLCSSYDINSLKDIDHDSIFFFIKKPEITDGMEKLLAILKPNYSMKKTEGHVPISIKLLKAIGVCPGDIYIQINEEKFIKIYNAEEIFSTEEVQKYQKKDRAYLHIDSEDSQKVLSLLTTQINLLFTESKKDLSGEALDLNSFIFSAAKEIGINQEVIELSKPAMKFAINIIKKNTPLKDALLRLFKKDSDFVPQHSLVLAMVSCAIASEMKWNSELTMCKLSLAGLIHDLELENAQIKEYEMSEVSEFSEKFKYHPTKLASLLTTIKDIPPDIDRIIAEHHEKPDGSGFPFGKKHLQISALSSLFIIAHELSNIICEKMAKKEKLTQKSVLEKLNKELYNKGNFKKVLKALNETSFL